MVAITFWDPSSSLTARTGSSSFCDAFVDGTEVATAELNGVVGINNRKDDEDATVDDDDDVDADFCISRN